MRRRKHRGREKGVKEFEPLSIEKIESRFEERLKNRKLLAEAFLLGKNKYGNTDLTPKRAI